MSVQCIDCVNVGARPAGETLLCIMSGPDNQQANWEDSNFWHSHRESNSHWAKYSIFGSRIQIVKCIHNMIRNVTAILVFFFLSTWDKIIPYWPRNIILRILGSALKCLIKFAYRLSRHHYPVKLAESSVNVTEVKMNVVEGEKATSVTTWTWLDSGHFRGSPWPESEFVGISCQGEKIKSWGKWIKYCNAFPLTTTNMPRGSGGCQQQQTWGSSQFTWMSLKSEVAEKDLHQPGFLCINNASTTDLRCNTQSEAHTHFKTHSFNKSPIKQACKIISEPSLSCFQTASIQWILTTAEIRRVWSESAFYVYT